MRDDTRFLGRPYAMVIEGVIGGIFCALAVTMAAPRLLHAFEHGEIWSQPRRSPGRYVSMAQDPAEFWWLVGFYAIWLLGLAVLVSWRIRTHYLAYRRRTGRDGRGL